MQQKYSTAVDTARNYYNSNDADSFYYNIWGGEDIHIGLYATPDEPIFPASRRTVSHMADLADGLDKDSTVLDIGAGYGGAARYLAKNRGCRVVALNLSEAENERDRTMNRDQGLDHLIKVVDGNFEDIPAADQSFDLVWSQDALLHSGERRKVLSEVDRVIKPGGRFIFTDPMQADDCPAGVLQPILDRIHLNNLASPQFYRQELSRLGFVEETFEAHHEQLPLHYERVLQETIQREEELVRDVSQEYIDKMKTGLRHWVEGGRKGHLAWGIFSFRKA